MENDKIGRDENQYIIVLKYLLKLKKDIKIIEIGAGRSVLRNKLPKNIKYYSMDMSKGHNYVFNLNKGKLPIKDKSFDLLICLETLEHVFYPHRVAEELKRIVKDDGIFILSMPNEYNFWQRFLYLFAIKTKTNMPFRMIEDNLHIHTPRVKDIIKFYSRHFEIKKVKYIWQSRNSHNIIIHWADKFIDILGQIFPSLFSRMVIVFARKKS